MAIEVTNFTAQEPLDFKFTQLVELKVKQVQRKTIDAPAKFSIEYVYKMFAVDTLGNIHYQPQTRTIIVDDYIALAMQRAQIGDLDLFNTLEAIEKTLATIQTELGQEGSASVTNI